MEPKKLFSLRIVSPGSIRSFELSPGDISQVGRDEASHIFIEDPRISSHQLTLDVQEGYVDVAVNPRSQNRILKGGKLTDSDRLIPGGCFEIGPYRFELEDLSELPTPRITGLPPDPAGPIDISLALDARRVAPRWSTIAGARPEPPKKETTPPPQTASWLRRIALPAAALAVFGLVAWLYIFPTTTDSTNKPAVINVDLLAGVARPNCASEEACLGQAREAFDVAEKLRQSGARDLVTLYRRAKQLQRAQLALGGRTDRLPDLMNSHRRARTDLTTTFSDLQFRFQRANAEGDIYGQLAALQPILALCAEDPMPFCIDRQRIYQALRERLQQR